MNKSTLFKIAGILAGSFVVITVATFFLYPYINEQKYEQVQAERQEGMPAGEYEGSGDGNSSNLYNLDSDVEGETGTDADSLIAQDSSQLMLQIDSLFAANDSLTQLLDSTQTSLANLEKVLRESGADDRLLANFRSGEGNVEFMVAAEEPKEEFAERVKSLLNLDEEELTPIANQMSQQELVKIYSSSGNIQREKLLRSLSPERAAKLMQEIML